MTTSAPLRPRAAATPSPSSIPLARMRNSSTPIWEMSRLTSWISSAVRFSLPPVDFREGAGGWQDDLEAGLPQRPDGDVLDVRRVDPPLQGRGQVFGPEVVGRLRLVHLVDEDGAARQIDPQAEAPPAFLYCAYAQPTTHAARTTGSRHRASLLSLSFAPILKLS